MKITINDVAREAGVSKSTVSRVLSNNARISEETKEKVNEVINRLGYKPNIIARNLAKNQTRTLGVILPIDASDYFGNPIYIQIMQGISVFAQENNYFIMYAFGRDMEANTIKEYSSSSIVDGIIMMKSEVNDPIIKHLQQIQFPFVVIGRLEESNSGLWVDNDNVGITYKIVEELIKRGHEKIALIGAKENWTVSKDRLEGYKKALEAYNISYNNALVYHGMAFTEETGYEAMRKHIIDEIPTAIVTTDDLIAVGVNRYLNEMNIVGKAVIGFNNTAIASYQKPTLTSVEINGIQLGYEAAKLIVNFLETGNIKQPYKIVEADLVRRNSYK